MRGDTEHPVVVEHVHLGEIALVSQQMGKHLVLIGEFPAARMQCLLVERGKGDGVNLAALRGLDSIGQRLACQPPGFWRHCSALGLGGVDIAQIKQWHALALPCRSVQLLHQPGSQGHAGIRHALCQHAGVANDGQPGDVRKSAACQQSCANLWSNAGRIAKEQGDAGQGRFLGSSLAHIRPLS